MILLKPLALRYLEVKSWDFRLKCDVQPKRVFSLLNENTPKTDDDNGMMRARPQKD